MTPIEELIEDLKVMSNIPDNYPISSILAMVKMEYLTKEKEHLKKAVIKTRIDGFISEHKSIVQDREAEPSEHAINAYKITAEQYYKENYETR